MIIGGMVHAWVNAAGSPGLPVYWISNESHDFVFNLGISSPGANDNLQDFADGSSCVESGNQLMTTRFVAGYATIEAASRTAVRVSAERPHETI